MALGVFLKISKILPFLWTLWCHNCSFIFVFFFSGILSDIYPKAHFGQQVKPVKLVLQWLHTRTYPNVCWVQMTLVINSKGKLYSSGSVLLLSREIICLLGPTNVCILEVCEELDLSESSEKISIMAWFKRISNCQNGVLLYCWKYTRISLFTKPACLFLHHSLLIKANAFPLKEDGWSALM